MCTVDRFDIMQELFDTCTKMYFAHRLYAYSEYLVNRGPDSTRGAIFHFKCIFYPQMDGLFPFKTGVVPWKLISFLSKWKSTFGPNPVFLTMHQCVVVRKNSC